MKNLISVVLGVAGISLILGLFSRLTLKLIPIFPGGLDAEALLIFTNTCLLVAIALVLLKISGDKL